MSSTVASLDDPSHPPPHFGACVPTHGVGPSRAAAQAVLITLLAWAALLCTGLGGTVGVVSQSLASKLAASAQYLQRQGGTSQALRAVRRDAAALTAQAQATEPPPAWLQDAADSAQSADASTPPDRPPHTDAHPRAPIEPALKPRHRAPPGRAPPALA